MVANRAPSTRLSRQFLLTRSTARAIPAELGVRVDLGGGWNLAHHPLLQVSSATSGRCDIWSLGSIYAPRKPEWTDVDVLRHLAQCNSFDELEAALDPTAGRHVILIRMDGEFRLYTDACGMRCAYFMLDAEGISVASQPGLLAPEAVAESGLRVFRQLVDSSRACTFPVLVVPYGGIRQVLPNHRLDLQTGKTARFWPRDCLPRYELEDAANAIAELWRGSLLALAERHDRLALPLTGGYDSRGILAAGWGLRDRLWLFTIVDRNAPFSDWWLALRLARIAGRRWHPIWAGNTSARQVGEMRDSTAYLWRDPNETRNPALGKALGEVVLLGTTSELLRHDPAAQEQISTPEGTASLQGWPGNREAIAAARQWLDGIPGNCGIDLSDLWYWEVRLGIWSSLDCLAVDAFADTASPTNCREMLAIALATDRECRLRKPTPHESYALHRRVLELNAPALLRIPFNRTWFDRIAAVIGNRGRKNRKQA